MFASAFSRILRFRSEVDAETQVHFHQGPQGQPVPCFEHFCSNPHLAVR